MATWWRCTGARATRPESRDLRLGSGLVGDQVGQVIKLGLLGQTLGLGLGGLSGGEWSHVQAPLDQDAVGIVGVHTATEFVVQFDHLQPGVHHGVAFGCETLLVDGVEGQVVDPVG